MANLIKFFGISAIFLLSALAANAEKPTITPAIINLGKVTTDIHATVNLHNTTTKPLVITRIEADCHCTKTTFSRRPIAVAESTKINITYSPTSDRGVFYKAIKVHTSASKEPLSFIIRGTNNQ